MDSLVEDASSRRGSSPTSSVTDLPSSTIGDMDVDSDSEGALGLEGDRPLKPDLEDALDFGERSYFFGEGLPDAPNPCLNIEGLGPTDLPLGALEAKAIINLSSGENGTPGGGIWELEGTKVKFDNPTWPDFIETIVEKVCQALGPKIYLRPRWELSKLCLYEAGSQILPQRDSSEAFAKFVIVLPSQHTGGDVQVSHDTSTKVLDSSSLSPTSVLAWYTGVTYEMSPITSGCRLALTYSIISASEAGDPQPEAPELADDLKELRSTLQSWHQGTYTRHSKIAVCLLKHKYTPADLELGEHALKVEDAFRVANVKSVAEQLGYMTALANLTCHEYGIGEFPDDYNPKRAKKLKPSEVDWYESPERSITLEDLVDLKGNRLLRPKPQHVVEGEDADEDGGEENFGTNISIDYEDLIPSDPFDEYGDIKPDKKVLDLGERGHRSCFMAQYYYKSVLVLVHEDDASKTLFSRAGVYFALQKLSQLGSSSPNPDDRKLAELVMKYLSSSDRKTPNIMADIAVKWKDLALWTAVIEKSDLLISTFRTESFLEARKTFSFEDIRPTLEVLLSNTKSLGDCLQFAYAFLSSATPGSDEFEMARQWTREQSRMAFTSCSSPETKDVSALTALACTEGVPYFLDKIIPQLKGPSNSDFYCALVKSLWESKEKILQNPPHTQALREDELPKEIAGFDRLLETCLDKAIPDYSSAGPQFYDNRTAMNIIETCLLTSCLAPCRKLFAALLKIRGPTREKFENVYCRLIPSLREFLSSKNIDIFSSPVIDLFQILIAMYLHDVLGSKPDVPVNIRKLGCGCADCKPLDAFLLQTKETETFRYPTKRRNHVYPILSSVSDLIAVQTFRDRSPHKLAITKLPDFLAMLLWKVRVTNAKAFLKSIGDDNVIARLMGDRHEDVLKAIQGVQRFTLAGNVATVGTSLDVASASSSSGPGASIVGPTTKQTTGSLAGSKRKRTPT